MKYLFLIVITYILSGFLISWDHVTKADFYDRFIVFGFLVAFLCELEEIKERLEEIIRLLRKKVDHLSG